jgi:hypothetical protein
MEMFQKIFLSLFLATCAGFCWASDMPDADINSQEKVGIPPPAEMEKVTLPSAVHGETYVIGQNYEPGTSWTEQTSWIEKDPSVVRTYSGTDEDCFSDKRHQTEVAEVISKEGSDVVVRNNVAVDKTFSGGANMTHGRQAPAGFNSTLYQAQMPLLAQEMLEDDGGPVLAMSRSPKFRRVSYGTAAESSVVIENFINTGGDQRMRRYGLPCPEKVADGSEIVVNSSEYYETPCEEKAYEMQTVAPSGVTFARATTYPAITSDATATYENNVWVVASGQTLRDVLQDWSDREGWTLAWATGYEYPIAASAVFKGDFMDATSAVVRNFSRATPAPYAKFYKGNKVLVVSTAEDK